jgi:TonB-linked SusC/RagA family outer membrane protein
MKKLFLLTTSIFLTFSVFAQETVSGLVTEETGGALPGVNILIKGTQTGSVTDLNGEYSIEVQSDDVLVFSFIGYQNLEIPVGDRTQIDVKMVPQISELEEIVVTGYGQMKRLNVTGAVATVSNDEIVDVPVANTQNALAGKLPGVVFINRGGEPGYDDSDIRIRGFEDSPLIIVDGIETEFSRIDPNDIESISVLKDGSAAIYGARAGNGVILITTKRGLISDKPSIRFSTSIGQQGSTVYPEYVDAAEYMTLLNDVVPGKYSEELIESYRNGTEESTDWFDETFRKSAPLYKANLGIRGGSERVNYYFSYGYLNQESILKSNDTKYIQHNIISNITVTPVKSLDVSLDINARNESREFPGTSIANILQNVAFSIPWYDAVYPDPSYPSFNGAGMGPNYMSQTDVTGYDKDVRRFYTGALTLNYKPAFLDGFSAKAFVNILSENKQSKTWRPTNSYYRYDPETDIYTETELRGTENIYLYKRFDADQKITAQFSLNYNKTFGNHHVSALLLNELIDTKGDWYSVSRSDYISDATDQMVASAANYDLLDGQESQDGRVSFVGRFNYNYKEKYLAEFMFREDASPRFHKDVRWGFFPSFSAGWRLSEESFLDNVEAISNLKLRLSYGQMGYDTDVRYNYLTGYEFLDYKNDYVFSDGGEPSVYRGISSVGLPNEEATWETMTIYNAGINLSLWQRKLYSEIDVFYRTREGILATRSESLPSTFGANLPVENLNSQNSRGFEIILGHSNTIGDVRYWVEGNISYARSKWDHYEEPIYADEESRARYQQSGQWVNQYYGLEAAGLFADQEELDAWPIDQDGNPNNGINHNLKPGDIKYLDYNGDSLITDLDEHVIGRNNIPEIFFGINVGLRYKGIDFTMLWQGASNYNVAFTAEAQRPWVNNATPLDMFMDRWTVDDPDPNARFPRTPPPAGSSNNYGLNSTFWLQDGTYIRLKNLALGYTFPAKMTRRIAIESLRIYFSGINLLTFSGVYPYDPETPDQARGWNYPQQRTYMFGIVLEL